jgi:hypothetical protein
MWIAARMAATASTTAGTLNMGSRGRVTEAPFP